MSRFLLLKDRVLRGELQARAGDVVYTSKGYDYGLASDDTRLTGIEHVSVTLNENGDYPSFTVPRADLKQDTPQ